MKKEILGLLFSISIAVLFVGCGKTSDYETSEMKAYEYPSEFYMGDNLKTAITQLALSYENFDRSVVSSGNWKESFIAGFILNSRLSFDYLDQISEKNNGQISADELNYIQYSLTNMEMDFSAYDNGTVNRNDSASSLSYGWISEYDYEYTDSGVLITADLEVGYDGADAMQKRKITADLVKNPYSCFDGYSITAVTAEAAASDDELENLTGEYEYASDYGIGKLMIEKTFGGYNISDYESESSCRFLADSSNIEAIENNRIYIKYPEQVFSDDTVIFCYYILEYGTDEIKVYYGKDVPEEVQFLYRAVKKNSDENKPDDSSNDNAYFLSKNSDFYKKAASNPIDQIYVIDEEAAPLEIWQSALKKCDAWNQQIDFTGSELEGLLSKADYDSLQNAISLWHEYYQEEIYQNRELYGNNGLISGSIYTAISADVLIETCKLTALTLLSQEYEMSGNVSFAENVMTTNNDREYSISPQSFCIEYSSDFEETLITYSIDEKNSDELEEIICETANKIEEKFGHDFAEHTNKYVSFLHALYTIENDISDDSKLCLKLKENRLKLYAIELLNIIFMIEEGNL